MPQVEKRRIKTAAPSDAPKSAEEQTQALTTATETNDQEPQEKRRESLDQNTSLEKPTVEESTENNEAAKDKEKLEEVEEVKEEKNEPEEPEEPEEAASEEPEPSETKLPALPGNNVLPPGKLCPTPKKAPKFKQRQQKQFKSKPPKKGVIGFGDDIPGMDGLGTDITVICPWEAFSHLELHELAQFGII
ncbi:uncharacterized protein RB166_015329 [Leptodactylus fuscus]